ncbi:S-layer homology domain-containing protein [Paenibacillus sp. S-38]|uniref:S-layer homology domain-containing protein n=1 Tax=Paenibacillus sp. S-38 TaxID=3416710 RepID=UPI003CEB799B
MKPAVLQKTAQVTVLMLIISVLLPVLAFGSGFSSGTTYKKGTVTGQVYLDVYNSVYPSVYAYSPEGSLLDVADVTYSSKDVNGAVYFKFTSDVGTYNYVKLKFNDPNNVNSSVYQTVYRSKNSPGGGGGPSGGSASGAGEISANSDGSVNADQLISSLNLYDTVTINITGDFALIPAKALVGFTSGNKTIIVKNANGSYVLPVKVLNVKDLASQLSATTDDVNVKVTVAKASQAIADSVASSAKALGGEVVAGAVDFNLTAVGKNNASVAVNLGGTYVSRYLPLPASVDSDSATGVLIDTTTNKLSFVPTVFSSTYADLKRNGNSVYAVIKLDKSFSDVSGHWAQNNIELLANKLVVDGVTDTSFEPERSITRAEFAALVVRSLGLTPMTGSSSFSDVESSDWFSSTVNSAVYAKIIDGYEDGTFRPNATINREELAAMVVRALNYAGAKPAVTASEQSTLLAKFSDSDEIVWAEAEVATAIKSGIVDGLTDDTLGARDTATRAQAATMLKRLLTTAKFIN